MFTNISHKLKICIVWPLEFVHDYKNKFVVIKKALSQVSHVSLAVLLCDSKKMWSNADFTKEIDILSLKLFEFSSDSLSGSHRFFLNTEKVTKI